jgi:hypothetical protein
MRIRIIVALCFSCVIAYCQNTDSTRSTLHSTLIQDSSYSKKLKIFNINFGDSIFRFVDFVKYSHVTVFIITNKKCVPCHKLIKVLESDFSRDTVILNKAIFFTVNAPLEGENPDEYNGLGYQCFKNIDELSSVFPTTIIFSPTGNQYDKIVGLNPEKVIACIRNLVMYCK